MTQQQFENGYALLIGVDEHLVPAWALPDVIKDISALSEVLQHPNRCAYIPDNVKVITGKEATGDGILDGFVWLREKISADSSGSTTAFVYYSGHGFRDNRSGDQYFVPYDVPKDPFRARRKMIPAADFAADIADISANRVFVILDCCHAGGMGVKDIDLTISSDYEFNSVPDAKSLFADAPPPNNGSGAGKSLDALTQGQGRAVLTSSRSTQKSYMRTDGKMSIFTYHLIEALNGHAQPGYEANDVRVSDIMGYINRKVPATAQSQNVPQNPTQTINGEDFSLALLLGGQGLSKGMSPPDPLEPILDTPLPAAGGAGNVTTTTTTTTTTNIDTGGGMNVSGDMQMGDNNMIFGGTMTGGTFVGGNQTVTHGDTITGDKIGGDRISIGNISGSTGVAIGRGASAHVTMSNTTEEVQSAFDQIFSRLNALPDTMQKTMLQQALESLQDEAARGPGADESKIEQGLKIMVQLLPDIGEIAINTFINPVQGLSTAFQKVAKRLR